MNNIHTLPFTMRLTIVLAVVCIMGLLYACPDSDGPSIEANRAPSAPKYLTMFAGDTELTIMWGVPTDTGVINGDGSAGTISGYKVYYSTTDGFDITDTTGVTSAEVTTTSYTITGLTSGTMYYVVVTALNTTGESVISSQILGVPGVLVAWSTYNKNNPIAQTRTGTAISTLDDLKAMSVVGEYYLTTNIDLGATNWTPLHVPNAPLPPSAGFAGTLHGNGYILYNLNIDAASAHYQGLFSVLKDAKVVNLGIGVGNITAGAAVGALAGYARGTSLLKNIAAGSMTASSEITANTTVLISLKRSYAGGIVGYMTIYSTLINGWNEHLAVRATGTTFSHGCIGGLVGYNSGLVTGASSGDVSSNAGSIIGGLVGWNVGVFLIQNEVAEVTGGHVIGSASGDVSSDSGNMIGGLVGMNRGGLRLIGTASGNVSSNSGSNIGGLVGENRWGTLVIGTASGNVSSNSGSSVGGLIGNSPGVDLNNVVVTGYSTGWVMVGKDNEKIEFGAVIGNNIDTEYSDAVSTLNAYYNSNNGAGKTADHVGTIDEASTTNVNLGDAEDTGKRGTNGLGIAINGIANATTTNMGLLTEGTDVGQWTFTVGEWPTLNLLQGITDYIDYTTSPAQPDNFVD